jgi:hypothetical protein
MVHEDWPDGSVMTHDIHLEVYDLADTSLVWSQTNVPTTQINPTWNEYTISGGLVPPDHFLIAVVQIDTATNADGLMVDNDTIAPYSPYWGHDWSLAPGGTQWSAPGGYGNFMIRAEMTCAPEAGEGFVRGDCDTVPGVFMSDAIYLLRAKFVPGATQCPCVDAADANDNGDWTMGDAIAILRWLFVPGADTLANPQPSLKQSAAIYPGDCGPDQTADALNCGDSPCR